MNNFIPEFMEVLTTQGWIEISKYRSEDKICLLSHNFKVGYLKPKLISQYNYNGDLLEIKLDNFTTYCKPSSKLLSNGKSVKGKDLRKGNTLDKVFMGSRIENITTGQWQGKMFELFFEYDLFMPVKFENDYCLIIV